MGKLGSQSGLSEVKIRLMCSFTSDITFGLLVKIYEVVPWRARGNLVFSVWKKIELFYIVGFVHRNFGHSSTSIPLRSILIGDRRLRSISLMYSSLLMIRIVELPVMG